MMYDNYGECYTACGVASPLLYKNVRVRTEHEDSLYIVIADIAYGRCKKRYLRLMDCDTLRERIVPIGYYVGDRRLLIWEGIRRDRLKSKRLIIGKINGEIIAFE
jgi:hypothetical protein